MRLEKLFTLGLISTGVLFTACSEEEEIIDEGNGGGTDPVAITIDGSATLNVGDIVYSAVDTVLQDSVMKAAGEDMIWNFEWLAEHSLDTTNVVDPASTSLGSLYPTSNLAMSDGGPDQYIYVTTSGTGVLGNGITFNVLGNIIPIVFQESMVMIEYPLVYGNTFSNPYGTDQILEGPYDVDVGGATITADSVRIKRTGVISSEVDGWGSIVSPLGTFDVLRLTQNNASIDSIWGYATVFPGAPADWYFVQENVADETIVQFISNEHALPVVEFTTDNMGVQSDFATFLK